MPSLVLVVLLVAPFAASGVVPSRAQEASGISSTVLVSGAVEADAGSVVAVSAARLILLTGQATRPFLVRGTVLMVLEFGRVRIETDAPLPGITRRDDGTSGPTGIFYLATAERATLTPGSKVWFRNDAADPAGLLFVAVVPVGGQPPATVGKGE